MRSRQSYVRYLQLDEGFVVIHPAWQLIFRSEDIREVSRFSLRDPLIDMGREHLGGVMFRRHTEYATVGCLEQFAVLRAVGYREPGRKHYAALGCLGMIDGTRRQKYQVPRPLIFSKHGALFISSALRQPVRTVIRSVKNDRAVVLSDRLQCAQGGCDGQIAAHHELQMSDQKPKN